MFAAQVDLAETVLRHAGGLQQHLVQRGITALRDGLQSLGGEIIGAGAEARLDLLPRLVQLLGHDINVDSGWCRCRLILRQGRLGQGRQCEKHRPLLSTHAQSVLLEARRAREGLLRYNILDDKGLIMQLGCDLRDTPAW
jgi:hypothetical protein